MYNTSNSKLLDVEPPTPFVPNAWKWDEATQTWLEYNSAAIEAARNPVISKEMLRAAEKAKRDADVAAIIVTTSTGKQFNGDETSQTRMARAIVAMQAANTQSMTWVLATNDAVEVTLAELSEALVLAGKAQAAIWVLPN
jgi:hypothetical protein